MKLVSTISPGLAEEYGLRNYVKGDCVLFQNEYYRCIAAEGEEVTPDFPMDKTKWEKLEFAAEITTLRTDLTAETTAREDGDKTLNDKLDEKAILVGENKNKEFSLDGDYGQAVGVLSDLTNNTTIDNVRYFVIPAGQLPTCAIWRVQTYGSSEVTYTDPIKLVLWSYSGSGALDDTSCKYLGVSDNTQVQEAQIAALFQFTSNPYGLPITSGQGLIIQGIPGDVDPDDSWKWSEKSSLYAVLSPACHTEQESGLLDGWATVTNEGIADNVRFCGYIGIYQKNSVLFSTKNGGISVSNGIDKTVEAVDATYKTNAQGIGTIILDAAKSYADTAAAEEAENVKAVAVLKGTNYADTKGTVPSFSLSSNKEGVVGDGTYVSVSPTTYFEGSVRGSSSTPTVDTVDTVYTVTAVEATGESTTEGIGTIILDAALVELADAATHTYTLGAGGASNDRFSKSRYAILSPLSLPYGDIKSVAVMASTGMSVTGAKYMLLWAHNGSGSYSSSTCTFLGKSTEAVEQVASQLSTWTFDGVVLPQDCGLIVQLIPSDATPTGDAWDWDADSGRFEVMSCKCQHGRYGNIINAGGRFFSNYELYCEVVATTKCPAGKLLTGKNVAESSLVGQTDYFAPVTRSGSNTLKVDLAGLSPYGSEAGHYGAVAVCDTSSGYSKQNLGQSVLAANSRELVILKPNQLTGYKHPGVISPSATAVPADKTELDTAISGDKAIIKAYAPTATTTQLGLVKPSIDGLPISTEEMTADIGIGDGMIKAIIPKNLSAYTNAEGESGFATRKEMSYATHYVLRVVTATETDNAFSVADGEHLRILFDGSYYGDVTITPPASVGDISQSFLVETTTQFTLKYNTGDYGELSRQYASWNNRPILVRFDSAHVISREAVVTSDCIFWTGTICDYFSVLPEIYRITPVNETSGDGGTGYTIEYGDAPGSHHYGLYSPWDV